MFITRSLEFYPGYIENNTQELSDEIIVPLYFLNRIMDSFDDGETLYLNMTNMETEQSYLVTIGSPHSYDKNTIYAPKWILDLIGCSGDCDSVIKLKKANMSDISIASKITIKPLDPVAFDIDTVACFEKSLVNLHSIKEGIILPIKVPELGDNYIIYAYIDKVEPESVSRIVSSEVDVEFINEFKEKNLLNPYPSDFGQEDNTTITPSEENKSQTTQVTHVTQELSAEERRQRVRDAWVKRSQNI